MPRRIVSVEELSIVSVVVKFCFVGKTAETALLFSACLYTQNIFPYQTCIYRVDNVFGEPLLRLSRLLICSSLSALCNCIFVHG